MCGICGIHLNDTQQHVDRDRLRRMRDVMFHRGPDAGGEYFFENVALGHRRLKIIDLTDAAAQPMANSDGTLVIVYNGEIYNFRELRRELERLGRSFVSSSDTEVILRLYEQEGESMVRRLNGIFAFAIYNRKDGTLFCARDPVGVKPLYYTVGSEGFMFASEIKALLSAGTAAAMNKDAIGEYLIFHCTAGERTLFRHIHRLLPGHTLTVKKSSSAVRIQRYWSLFQNPPARGTSQDRTVQLQGILESAVQRQMISDVPVGTMCSGGLDSSGLTAIAARYAGSNLNTFSISFDEARFSEAPFARQVSAHCRTTHNELVCNEGDFTQLLADLVWLHDEPMMHPNSVPMFQISRLAKSRVTVLLSGEGADELFGGYFWQRRFERMARWHPWTRQLARLGAIGAKGSSRERWERFFTALSAASLSEMMVWTGAIVSPGQVARMGFRGPMDWPYRLNTAELALNHTASSTQARMLYDQMHYLAPLLDRQDKMCMGASVESRVPFLDPEVIRFANGLPSEAKINKTSDKYALRQALRSYLPEGIVARPKFGFGVPVFEWLRTSPRLREMINALGSRTKPPLCVELGLLEQIPLRRAVEAFLTSSHDLAPAMWSVLNLEIWASTFIEQRQGWRLASLTNYETAHASA